MSKQQFEDMCAALYTAYVNISGKYGVEPMPFRTFRMRMRIWEW